MSIVGQKFKRFTVIEEAKKIGDYYHFKCVCDCGNVRYINKYNLIKGKSGSCGCYTKDHPKRETHGKSKTKLYGIWKAMKERCQKKYNQNFFRYGERGISVCKEWEDFSNFYNWCMENGFKNKLQLDRIDNNGNYSPQNCRFITPKENSRNRRDNKKITYNGETKTMIEFSEIYGINYNTLYNRIFTSKWSVEKALNTPIRKW